MAPRDYSGCCAVHWGAKFCAGLNQNMQSQAEGLVSGMARMHDGRNSGYPTALAYLWGTGP